MFAARKIFPRLSQNRALSRFVLADPSFISEEFIDAASTRLSRDRETKLSDVTSFLDLYKSEMSSSNLINFLTCMGRRRFLRPYHIFVVASTLQSGDRAGTLSLDEIDSIADSLKFYPATVGSVRILLEVMTDNIRLSQANLSSQRVGKYIYSLRNMRSGHIEVRGLLGVLRTKIGDMNERVNLSDAVVAIEGMQQLSSDYHEVLDLISTLTANIADDNDSLTGPQLLKLLNGLQRFDLKAPEVHNLLSIMLDRTNGLSFSGISQRDIEIVLNTSGNLLSCEEPIQSRLAHIIRTVISLFEGDIPHDQVSTAVDRIKLTIDEGKHSPEMKELLREIESHM